MGDLVLKGATSGQITITPTGVAGTNTLTLPAATGNIITSADSGTVTQAMLASNVAGNGPAFSATGTTVTAATATYVKLPFNSKYFDTNNNYDATTNYRFTPSVAGYYQITISCQFWPASSNAGNVNLYKNGTLYTIVGTTLLSAGIYPHCFACGLIYLNGTTDYIECYGYQASGGNLTISCDAFSAYLARSA